MLQQHNLQRRGACQAAKRNCWLQQQCKSVKLPIAPINSGTPAFDPQTALQGLQGLEGHPQAVPARRVSATQVILEKPVWYQLQLVSYRVQHKAAGSESGRQQHLPAATESLLI
jgi:hypothetical protein